MRITPTAFTLNKECFSPRGTAFPPGTIFIRENHANGYVGKYDGPGHWYSFIMPSSYKNTTGFLFIPNRLFDYESAHDIQKRIQKRKLIEEHIKRHQSFYRIPT